MPSPVVRRLISWPTLVLAWVVLVAFAPLALIVAVVIDLVTKSWRFRLVRLYLLVVGVVTNELVMLVIGSFAIVVTLDGRLVDKRRWAHVVRWLQTRWFGNHLALARAFAGLRLEVENPEELEGGNFVVVARHFSHYDALFPGYVIDNLNGYATWYTLKQELQWPPAMDLMGNRLNHVWIDRAPRPGSRVLGRIRQLGARVDADNTAVIFPEGTFFTPERLERAATRLDRTEPAIAERARRLQHLLPPRPAGVAALLDGAPEADVLIMGNVGIESFTSIRSIVRSVPIDRPARIRFWRHPRRTVPDEPGELAAWLTDRWLELDAWVAAALSEAAEADHTQTVAQ